MVVAAAPGPFCVSGCDVGVITKIEWCDSSLNMQMGCDGCELWAGDIRMCYAGVLHERYGGRSGWPKSFDKPALFPDRLNTALRWPDLTGQDRSQKPWLNGLPRLIFLNDMGDTFTESLPVDWLAPYLPKMEASSHQWLILTKRAKRMREFFSGSCPPNVWLGVSVTDQRTADMRIPHLLQIPARVRFVSVEPMLAPVDLSRWMDLLYLSRGWVKQARWEGSGIDWVICGSESGPHARHCDLDWVRGLRNQCQAAGVAFFWKQYVEHGLKIPTPALDGRQWLEHPLSEGVEPIRGRATGRLELEVVG